MKQINYQNKSKNFDKWCRNIMIRELKNDTIKYIYEKYNINY